MVALPTPLLPVFLILNRLTIKLFKTLSYESTTEDPDPEEARWNCTRLLTDLSQGNINDLNFERKEGEWYAYVRHDSGV